MERGIQTPMAQGRSTEIISMIKWIRTSRLSIKISITLGSGGRNEPGSGLEEAVEMLPLSLSHTLTHSRARALSHTLAHSLPLSLSLSHTLTHSHSHSPESGGRDEPSSGVEEAIEMLQGDAVALALAGPRAGLYPAPCPPTLPHDA